MRELKYVPRAAARNLATRTTNTLGLVVSRTWGDFISALLTGIDTVATEQGFHLLISTAGQHGPHDKLPGLLGHHNTDGLLVFAGILTEAGLVQAHDMGLPMVFIHQTPPADLAIPCVTIENKAASNELVSHLIEIHGRRRIVMLRGPEGQEDSYWREMGYREALETHGIPFDEALVMPGDFAREIAEESIIQLINRGIQFDAIFAGDDEAAVGVLVALRSAGKRVPEDVAVVGFDDQRLSAVLTPTLTTVQAPTELVGRVAAEQLIRLIRTGEADPLSLLPTQIVIRQSCGCQPNEHGPLNSTQH